VPLVGSEQWLGKALRVLGHAELFEPVRNLLESRPRPAEFIPPWAERLDPWQNQGGPPIRSMLRRRTSQAKQLSFAFNCSRVIAVSRGPPSSWLASGVTRDPGLSSRAEIGILEGCRPVAKYSIGDVDIATLGVRLAAAMP
jgi:hypothetical protein